MAELETHPELATYCGLYCGACAMRNGQISNTAKTLQKLLDAFHYAEWAPSLADYVPATKHYPQFEGVLEWLTDQSCPTCLGGGGNPACEIRICAKEKGLVGCWACGETANCDKLGAETWAVRNCKRIREVGLDAWLVEQAAKVQEGFSYDDWATPEGERQ